MSFHTPEEILQVAQETGIKKARLPLIPMIILGFLAGAYISFGFLLYVRVSANTPEHIWGSLASFIGAAVFPLGLIFVLIAGGELLTGNMMALTTARLQQKIRTIEILKNWSIITFSNFIGAIFVAYFFGHFLGLTETGEYLARTLTIAGEKITEPAMRAFVSGIGANWLVCLAVWLAYAAKDLTGKILGIWFPIMAFVAIGFQHVVANMFIIPAAIFAGYFTWFDYFQNFIIVFSGNVVGGAFFVGGFYSIAYSKKD